jgi:pimeloyl-ACP methyl ester carboxylesterase
MSIEEEGRHNLLSKMPEDRYVKVGALRTRYWTLGNEGPIVILIHGLAVSADIWMYNVGPLAKQHRVYVPDLVGFGRSDKPGPSFSPFDYTLFLDEFLNSLNLDRVSLVGQSLGGGIALHYALRFPERVDRLILSDSAGLGKEVIWTLRMLSLPFVGELFSRPSRKGVEFVFKLAVHDHSLIDDDFVGLYYDFFSQPGFRVFFLRLLRQIVNIHGARVEVLDPIRNNLSRIAQPVLITWGDKDRVLPVKHAYFAKKRLPDSRLKIFKGCGHIPFFEKADEFNRLALEFLSEEENEIQPNRMNL